jgi:hypothetical protein
MQTWLFQANDEYDLTVQVPRRLGKKDDWLVRRYRDEMEIGDKVVLWQSGSAAGVYALGELTSTPYEAPSDEDQKGVEWRVDIRYTELLEHPIFKSELLDDQLLRGLLILRQPFAANPFLVEPDEWEALQELVTENTVNIFTHYKQEENQFTNALIALLEVSRFDSHHPQLLASFLEHLLCLQPREEVHCFRVLRDIDGTADAELCSRDCCIRIETKIRSGNLRHEQLQDHVKRLVNSPATEKVLVLLTPDDTNSDYIGQFLSSKHVEKFCSTAKHHRVVHLEWRRVYDYLKHFADKRQTTVLTQIVRQFLDQIHYCVLEEDFAGIVQKVAFDEVSGVNNATYLEEMEAGEWDHWNTPRKYEKLDGTGRKLLFYDKHRQAITAEVEIRKVAETNNEADYPWTNYFVPDTLCVYRTPIPLAHIETVPGFENFASGRSANWNVTREQYRQLTAKANR